MKEEFINLNKFMNKIRFIIKYFSLSKLIIIDFNFTK